MADDNYYDDELEDENEEETENAEVEMNAVKKRQLELEAKVLKNKLRAIMSRLSGGSTKLNESEKLTLKKAKKHETLKKDIKLIYSILAVNKTRIVMKTISASPVLYYVLIGVLILFLIICVVALVGSIMPWLFPEDVSGDGQVSSQFGITGKDFYGARMIYKDDEKAGVSIIADYVELVESGIEEIKTITSVKGTNVTLEVNITMPAEDYDYSNYDEATFQTEYPVLHTTILDVAKIVYKADNSVDYSGLNLLECVNGILYFGYGQTAMVDVSKIVTNSIINNVSETSGASINKQTDLDPLINEKLQLLYSNEKYNLRAEKLFVKDYILSGDDKRMENISKENYVSFIFMPKTNVTFTKFSFSVGNADLSGFEISLSNNGSEIILKKEDFDFGGEATENSYIYMSNENLNINVGTFTDIDANNLDALSEGVSLLDIVENVEIDYTKYLQVTTNEIAEYFTIKQNGVVVKLSNNEAFNFVEVETVWQAAS